MSSLEIRPGLCIPLSELAFSAIRAQGAGGQNVNKVSSAIHLRFDILHSSLPQIYKTRLLNSNDSRINQDGVLVLKAQTHRSQELNKQDAVQRLVAILQRTSSPKKIRRATKPSKASQTRRLDKKTKAGKQKQLRKKVDF